MSLETLWWWYRAGKLRATHAGPTEPIGRPPALPRLAAGTSPADPREPIRRPPEIARLPAGPTDEATGQASFAGLVRSLELAGRTALVEIEAGPFLFRAAVARDTVEELGLVAGSAARATVRGNRVVLDRGRVRDPEMRSA